MGVDAFSKSRGDQQVAPVGFRESNRISKPIELSSGIKVFWKRQVISTFFEGDLPCEFLMRWSKKERETAFGFRTTQWAYAIAPDGPAIAEGGSGAITLYPLQ